MFELGLMRNNYTAHPRYEEYVSKGGFNDGTWEDYECFVEWITRPPVEKTECFCGETHG